MPTLVTRLPPLPAKIVAPSGEVPPVDVGDVGAAPIAKFALPAALRPDGSVTV